MVVWWGLSGDGVVLVVIVWCGGVVMVWYGGGVGGCVDVVILVLCWK